MNATETAVRYFEVPERFLQVAFRKLSDDERDLLTHVSRWGSTGYPVTKLGKKWFWQYRSLEAPKVYRTKREAVGNFEAFHTWLIDLHAFASWRRACGKEVALRLAANAAIVQDELVAAIKAQVGSVETFEEAAEIVVEIMPEVEAALPL